MQAEQTVLNLATTASFYIISGSFSPKHQIIQHSTTQQDGLQVYRSTGLQVHSSTGPQVYRSTGCCSGGSCFEFRPGHRLPWQRFFVVFLGYDRFLPNHLQFIINPSCYLLTLYSLDTETSVNNPGKKYYTILGTEGVVTSCRGQNKYSSVRDLMFTLNFVGTI